MIPELLSNSKSCSTARLGYPIWASGDGRVSLCDEFVFSSGVNCPGGREDDPRRATGPCVMGLGLPIPGCPAMAVHNARASCSAAHRQVWTMMLRPHPMPSTVTCS